MKVQNVSKPYCVLLQGFTVIFTKSSPYLYLQEPHILPWVTFFTATIILLGLYKCALNGIICTVCLKKVTKAPIMINDNGEK